MGKVVRWLGRVGAVLLLGAEAALRGLAHDAPQVDRTLTLGATSGDERIAAGPLLRRKSKNAGRTS